MSVIIQGFKAPTENDPKTFLTHFNDDGSAEMIAVGYPQKKYQIVDNRGEWQTDHLIGMGIQSYHTFRCSKCGLMEPVGNFCKNCGAEMRSWFIG